MTQKDKLLKIINEKLNTICDRLLSYQKVDATLSEKTLLEVAVHLDIADDKLEKGFVNDACEEVEQQMMMLN